MEAVRCTLCVEGAARRSGRDIRHQLHFKQGYVILQLQLALFQAPQLELVVVAIEYQQLDHDIEIAMFDIELDQAQLDFLGISHGSLPTIIQTSAV
jgi:hypothetical protein